MLDTIIVGGGIAGLTTAYRLKGRETLLLEKEAVAGGRTLSRRLGEYAYNAGAQVILGTTSPVARLADELGVSRTLIAKTRIPMFYRDRLYRARTQPGLLMKLPLSLAEKLEFALAALKVRLRYRELAHKPFSPDDPKVIELTRSTLDEFLGSTSPGVKAIWDAIGIISDGEPGELTTPYHPIMVLMHFLDEEYAVDGGTHQLTLALHRALGERARLGAEVTRVRQRDDGVEVSFSEDGVDRQLRAKRCVMALPAPIALSLLDALETWKREALARVDYASQTSAAFLLDEPSARRMGDGAWRALVVGRRACAVTDPTFMYPPAVKARSGQGMLRIYTGDRVSKALMERSKEEAVAELRADLEAMFPGIDNHVVEADVTHWRYANPKWRPGHTELYPLLQQAAGRIHFCGDYTSPGYLNGSVLSAARVVEEITTSR